MTRTAAALTLAILVAAIPGILEVCSVNANPYFREYIPTIIPPPEETEPPKICIQTPENNTFYASNNLPLSFNVSIPQTNGEKSIHVILTLYYNASWKSNKTIFIDEGIVGFASYSINLTNIPDGFQSLAIYAIGWGAYDTKHTIFAENNTYMTYYNIFNKTGVSAVEFDVDTSPPEITVLSPQNTTYTNTNVSLNFAVNEQVETFCYSLDGKENETTTGNATLEGIAEGQHNITFYATDLAGNDATSETVFFGVDKPAFPTVPVVAVSAVSVGALAAGLLLFTRRKRNKGTGQT
jgi:hypothetical protein